MGSISLHEKPRDYPGVQLLDQCRMDSYPCFSQGHVGFDFDGFMKFHLCASSFCRSRHVCAKCESCFKIVILVEFLIPTYSYGCYGPGFTGILNSRPTVLSGSLGIIFGVLLNFLSPLTYMVADHLGSCVGAEGTSFSESKAFSNDHPILDP